MSWYLILTSLASGTSGCDEDDVNAVEEDLASMLRGSDIAT